MKFQIISDGSCDLKPSFAKENKVEVVPFYISYDKEKHMKEGVDLDINDFYKDLVNDPKLFPVTSAPNTEDYLEIFKKYAKEDIPMICLCITKKFSGSFSFANLAKTQLLEEYPNAQLVICDATVNTVLQGLVVKDLIKMRDEGYTIQQAENKIEEVKDTSKLLFTVNSLDYLAHGGRIGKASAFLGSILNINPIITMSKGELTNSAKTTSRKRAIARLKAIIVEEFSDKKASDYNIVVGYTFICEEIESFRDSIAHLLNLDVNEIHLETVGATIGVHTGPTAMGFGFIRKYNA